MNDTKSAGLRLPVQAAVDRTPTYAALADGSGIEAQGWFDDLIKYVPTVIDLVSKVATAAG